MIMGYHTLFLRACRLSSRFPFLVSALTSVRPETKKGLDIGPWVTYFVGPSFLVPDPTLIHYDLQSHSDFVTPPSKVTAKP